jgi:hypothetical protein
LTKARTEVHAKVAKIYLAAGAAFFAFFIFFAFLAMIVIQLLKVKKSSEQFALLTTAEY